MTVEGPPYRSLAGRAGGPILVLLIVAAVAQAMARLGPTLLRDDVFVGDAAQHTWWLARLADPALFPSDRIAAYYALPAYAPPGYLAVYRLCVPFATPQHVAETVAVVLALMAIGLTAWLGARIGKKTGAAVAVVALMLCHFEKLVEGGFPRSFGLVLVLAGVLAIVRHRWTTLGGLFVAATLFYPPTVLNLGPATAAVIGRGWRTHRRLPRGFVWLLLLGCVAVGLIAIIYLRPPPADVGRWFTVAEARQMPERLAAGRSTFFLPWRTFYFNSTVAGIGLTMHQAVAAAVALGLTVLWRPRAICAEAWALLGAALAMWVLAHLTLFALYLPSRYVTYALPVFSIMWAAGVAREIKAVILARSDRFGRWASAVTLAAASVLAVGTIAMAGRTARAAAHAPGKTWSSPGVDAVLRMLATLPKETLVAAHPDDANAIPLCSRRSVLTNTETSIAFHNVYYAEMSRRLSATFDLLYATDWATVDAIAAREHVGVFVLDAGRLTQPDAKPYFEPFRTANVARIAAGRRDGFALLSPPPERVLFRQGDWMVLRVGGGTP